MSVSQSYCEPKRSREAPSFLEMKYSLIKHRFMEKSLIQNYLRDAVQVENELQSLKIDADDIHTKTIDSKTIQTKIAHYAMLARRHKLLDSPANQLQYQSHSHSQSPSQSPSQSQSRTIKKSDQIGAVALICYVAEKTLGLTPYRVQIAAALAMLDGYLIQLAPGEGKTLTIGMVAAILGWTGKPCHIVTANDYLAQRDAALMQPFFAALKLSVSSVVQESEQSSEHRIEQGSEQEDERYQADVVYSTAKQLLADYLNDIILFNGFPDPLNVNLKRVQGTDQPFVMRGLYAVIVDEADSILIDDATTPLIISKKEENPLLEMAVNTAKTIVDTLEIDIHYRFAPDHWEVIFTQAGLDQLDACRDSLPRLWHHQHRLEDLISQAILARDRFIKDEHYVVVDEEVVLVDESTGRMMPGRSWSYGLHQAVETRAGLPITSPAKTMEKMSFQHFFQSFHHLTGASGTLQSITEELFYTYQIKTLKIPTRKSSQLAVSDFLCFRDGDAKREALVCRVEALHAEKRPVLIGTRRISDSEALAELFVKRGFKVDVLNAKNLAREADIVAQAGQALKITIATNMAGRGTDIHITHEALGLGGLCVLMYEPHESARVDWQLFGRAGRQGNPGSAVPLVALNDPLLVRHLPLCWRPLLSMQPWFVDYTQGWLGQVSRLLMTFLVRRAQENAQGKAFHQRKLLTRLFVLSKERVSFLRNKTR